MFQPNARAHFEHERMALLRRSCTLHGSDYLIPPSRMHDRVTACQPTPKNHAIEPARDLDHRGHPRTHRNNDLNLRLQSRQLYPWAIPKRRRRWHQHFNHPDLPEQLHARDYARQNRHILIDLRFTRNLHRVVARRDLAAIRDRTEDR